MIRRTHYLTKDERARRKRQRRFFIEQRLTFFKTIKAIYPVRIPLDWRKYLKEKLIQAIIQDARDILFYSPTTKDYSIWIVLFYNYEKLFRHDTSS